MGFLQNGGWKGLIVGDNGQQVIREIVQHYMSYIAYDDALPRSIELRHWLPSKVVVDVRRSFGQPIFPRGARFACPVEGCGEAACPVHDTDDKTWRHLDFFQHKAYLRARVPRVRCAECGVHQVGLSWARPESGFTLLFEALLITFATAMPVAKVAELTREQDTRIWRVIEHHVDTERALLSFAGVTKVGLDETAAARGQDYMTVFMDMVARRVLFATEGRDAATVERFAQDLREHGGDPDLVTDTSSDMSVAFISGIGEHLPKARMTFDRFHVMAKLSEAIDEVRRAEQKNNPALKKTRYVWLKNRQNLTVKQTETLAWLTRPSMQLAAARAHRWREDFQAFYGQSTDDAETYLRRWCYGAKRSRLQPVKDFVRLVESHWDGIVAWHRSRRHVRQGDGMSPIDYLSKVAKKFSTLLTSSSLLSDRRGATGSGHPVVHLGQSILRWRGAGMAAPPQQVRDRPAASTIPVLRRRLLLAALPMATGAGLVLHILAEVSLPLAIAAFAVLGAAVWLLIVARLRPALRAALRTRLAVGAVAGLVGTIAYDAARYGTVSLFSMSFKPFHVISIFGELFIGTHAGATTTFLVGLLYHLTNGTFFGVAYTLVFARPTWWTGALWGIGLELCMATLYPSWLRIVMLREFLEVSALGHVVYGTVLGIVAGQGVIIAGRRAERRRTDLTAAGPGAGRQSRPEDS